MRGGLFSGDVLPALHGFLLSPGKGVFWYSPPLLLGIFGFAESWKRFRRQTVLTLGIVLITLFVNAKFRIWHADYCWGPRHLAPVAPLILLWSLPWLPEWIERGHTRLRHFAVRSLVGLGIAVQLLGASLYWDHYIRALIAVKDQTGAPGWFRESLTHGHYIPVFSPLVGQVWLLDHMVRRDPDLDHDAPWKAIIPGVSHLEDIWSRLRIDWWPLEWLTNKDPFRPGTRPPDAARRSAHALCRHRPRVLDLVGRRGRRRAWLASPQLGLEVLREERARARVGVGGSVFLEHLGLVRGGERMPGVRIDLHVGDRALPNERRGERAHVVRCDALVVCAVVAEKGRLDLRHHRRVGEDGAVVRDGRMYARLVG